MTKREACARVAYESWKDDDPWADLDDIEKSYFLAAVDAIFAELAEPDEAMLKAGGKAIDVSEARYMPELTVRAKIGLQAMLRAAAGEGVER